MFWEFMKFEAFKFLAGLVFTLIGIAVIMLISKKK